MIEFSLGKLVLLALIALIVLGPEKLPGAARTAGALLRRVRNGWDGVRAEVERELEVEEIRRAAREAVAQVDAAQQEVKDGLRGAHEPLSDVVSKLTTMDRPIDDQPTAGQPTDGQPIEGSVSEAAALAQPEEPSPQAELPLGEPASVEPASTLRNAAHGDA